MITHPDGSHLGGASQVWRALPLRQVMLPVRLARSPAHRQWLVDAPSAGIKVHQAREASFPLPDDASLEVVYAPDPDAVNVRADERVAVFRIHWRGWKILMTGDAGQATEQMLVAQRSDLRSDVIVAGRNRDDPGLCDAFLDAVSPQALICSNHSFPALEKVSTTSMAHWRSRGIRVFDQNECGGVTLSVDDQSRLVIKVHLRDGATLLSPR